MVHDIDYGGVPIVIASIEEWLKQAGGMTWFYQADPFFRTVRESFSGRPREIRLCRAADSGLFFATAVWETGTTVTVWRFCFGNNPEYAPVGRY